MIKINNFDADRKLLKHHDKLDYFFNGHKTLIVTEFDLTNRCNNNCPSCCGVKENGAELSFEQIERVVDGLSRMNNRGVILSGGGEPLMSAHFSHAVRLIRKSGMRIGLNSNGLALTEELCRLIAENCDYFRISLDAATPELYERTHGMSAEAFCRVVDHAKMFSHIRNTVGSRTSFGIGYLTGPHTECDMESFVVLARECGADFAQFRPFTGYGFKIHDVSERIEEIQRKYATKSFRVIASMQKYREMASQGERNYASCRGMFFSTVVTADAKLFACLHFRQDQRYFLGQVDERTSVEDIFLSPRIREVFRSIRCEECPPLCRNDVFNRTLETLSLDVVNAEFM